MVDSLVAVSYCGMSVACAADQYGVAAIGRDSIIVGSGTPKAPDGTVLWTNSEERLMVDVGAGVQFFVTTPFGGQAYSGNATVSVPQGMFAYVSLSNTETRSAGILGWLSGQDHFRGWAGAVRSPNVTVQILMDSDKNLTATWTTDSTLPSIISSAAIAVILITIVSFVRVRIQNSKELRRPSTGY